jgi:hypothetical protein
MGKCKHWLLALGLGAAGTALTLEWGLTRGYSLQVQGLDPKVYWKMRIAQCPRFFAVALFGSASSPVNLHWHAVPGLEFLNNLWGLGTE